MYDKMQLIKCIKLEVCLLCWGITTPQMVWIRGMLIYVGELQLVNGTCINWRYSCYVGELITPVVLVEVCVESRQSVWVFVF